MLIVFRSTNLQTLAPYDCLLVLFVHWAKAWEVYRPVLDTNAAATLSSRRSFRTWRHSRKEAWTNKTLVSLSKQTDHSKRIITMNFGILDVKCYIFLFCVLWTKILDPKAWRKMDMVLAKLNTTITDILHLFEKVQGWFLIGSRTLDSLFFALDCKWHL